MIKRRAPKACIPCRNKKVKCDVSACGTPCGNCKRARVECTVNHARKRKSEARTDDAVNRPTDVRSLEVQTHHQQREHDDERMGGELEEGDASLDNFLPLALQDSEFVHSLHPSYLPDVSHATGLPPISRSFGPTNETPRDTTTSFSQPPEISPPPSNSSELPSRLPDFIKPLGSVIDAESIAFLERKQALSLPEDTVQHELMRSYIHYVHPFLPLLDIEDILLPLNRNPGAAQMSLVLYQAVMFAAASFVDMKFLHMAGFTSRLQGRKCLFERVKLLLDFDVESNLLTLTKVLVLMTYWYDKPDDPKSRTYWMRIALSYAYELGLNRDSELAGLDAKQQRSRRRLWWSCYTRDKLISFSERRPSGIREEENHLTILTPEDFEPRLFSQALRDYPAHGIVTHPEVLIELSIEHIELCILLGHVLDTQYLTSGHRRTANRETMITLLPKTSRTLISDFMVRDQELRGWGERICSRLTGAIDPDPDRNCRLVSLHSAVLEMVFQTVLSTLHRPLIASKHPLKSVAQELQVSSQKRVKEGAQRITEIASYLAAKDLLRYVPPIGVTTLLTAAIQHIKDMKSSNAESHDAATERLEQTMQALKQLREVYCSASHAISFAETVWERETRNGTNRNDREQRKPLNQNERWNHSTAGQTAGGDSDSRPTEVLERAQHSDRELSLTPLSSVIRNTSTPTPGATTHDLEAVTNVSSLSELFPPEDFGVLDFDGLDWMEDFQELNSTAL